MRKGGRHCPVPSLLRRQRATRTTSALLPGIGRYLEDTYDGVSTNSRGNPWFLGTAAFAELCYRSASNWSSAGSLPITTRNIAFLRGTLASQGTQVAITEGDVVKKSDARFGQIIGAMIELGDGYLRRVQQHAGESGSLSEQFDRNDGSLQSARDLSWSYAAVLTAFSQREIAVKSAKGLQTQLVPGSAK
jgi:glucoamylase